nr:protein FAR1-RELATED SEQUENCE 5-like [Lolium perenne]
MTLNKLKCSKGKWIKEQYNAQEFKLEVNYRDPSKVIACTLFGFRGNFLNVGFIVEKDVASVDDGDDILGDEPEDQSRTNIAAYRENNNDVKFYFIHVFAPTETCDKWMDTRTALAKANAVFNPTMMPTPASDGPPIENKKTNALRNATPNTRLLRLNLVVVRGFVADSILRGFDLNKPAQTEGYDGADQDGNDAANFVPGPNSTATAGATNVAEEDGEEICSQPVVPFVGMIFDDLEVAKQAYNDYAWKLGFGTRIGNTKYSTARGVPKDTILSRVFECVHTGKPAAECKNAAARSKETAAKVKEASVDMSNIGEQKSRSKQAGSEIDVNESKQRNILRRCDCKAHMVAEKRNGLWSVTVFKEEHTHPMVKLAGMRRYYRSHRKVPEEDFQFIQTLHNQNITTAQIMGCLGNVHGGDPRTLGYVKRDVSNIRTMLREEVSHRDMSMVIEYFERRKAESPNFFYDTLVDSKNAIRGLFWVDGRTRALYPKYKDCVFFDTTFCTNKYNLPFAPIVGINNHTHTIVLGCALLPDETTETFKWVFERWMHAMNQMHPDYIMTNQDQAIATAIDKVFPNSVHRCCFYHVLHLARKKLGPNLGEGHPFADAFYSCIYGTDTIEEFEFCWQHMLRSFDMAENNHLNNMWKSRKTWAPVYFRKSFFPFTSTTGRSEGLNSYFKTLVRPSDSVWNFVQ